MFEVPSDENVYKVIITEEVIKEKKQPELLRLAENETRPAIKVKKAKKKNARRLQKERQMIFQDSTSSLNQKMKVEKILAEPLEIHKVFSDKKEQHDFLCEMMKWNCRKNSFTCGHRSCQADKDRELQSQEHLQ